VSRNISIVGLHFNKCFGEKGLSIKSGSYSGEFKASIIYSWEHIYYEQRELGLMQENRGRKKTMSPNKPTKQKLDKQTEENTLITIIINELN
jgi:hypothetical protein